MNKDGTNTCHRAISTLTANEDGPMQETFVKNLMLILLRSPVVMYTILSSVLVFISRLTLGSVCAINHQEVLFGQTVPLLANSLFGPTENLPQEMTFALKWVVTILMDDGGLAIVPLHTTHMCAKKVCSESSEHFSSPVGTKDQTL